MYDCEPGQPVESVAVMVKLLVETVVGVPLRVPFTASASPAGKVPALTTNVFGAGPLAAMVWLYGTPTVPLGKVTGETVLMHDCAKTAPAQGNHKASTNSQIAHLPLGKRADIALG
ncbi:MAG: hypothetical protein ABIP11_07485 [Luteimonas sp.]